jgi:Phage integrase SAM-like domain
LEQLAHHCQQTKYCEAEYDESGNKLFGVRDTSVYEAHLKHFKEFFGKIRVRDIRVGMLRAYRNHRLRSKTKGGGNINVGTVNREMNTLRAMLNEAKINDRITVNHFTKGRPGELISTEPNVNIRQHVRCNGPLCYNRNSRPRVSSRYHDLSDEGVLKVVRNSSNLFSKES